MQRNTKSRQMLQGASQLSTSHGSSRRERRIVSRDSRGGVWQVLAGKKRVCAVVEDSEGICCQRQSRTNDAADPGLPLSEHAQWHTA